VSGGEADYADALARHLERAGFATERQHLDRQRFNLLARPSSGKGEPRVVFCTHLDTVPPWFGPERRRGTIVGRGACDAKGPAFAMIEAARRLVASGEERIGLLFTVGEETDSKGAQLANERIAEPTPDTQPLFLGWEPRYTIVGEPTDNRFVRGGKGVVKGALRAHGASGHSAMAEGPSAIHELVGAIGRMLASDWGRDPLFGEGTINFGTIEGGVAANVTAPSAGAALLVRAVEDPPVIEARIRSLLGAHVEYEPWRSYGPIHFELPEGGDGPVVKFGTDAPYLGRFGKPLLYGPGSIRDAHTATEKIAESSLDQGIADYERAARTLLAR
jgi:acetylornithine deacetylase